MKPSPADPSRHLRLFSSLRGQLWLVAFTCMCLGFTAALTATLLINQRALMRQHASKVEPSSTLLLEVIRQLAADQSPELQRATRRVLRRHSSYTLLFWIHLPDGGLIVPENHPEFQQERLAQKVLLAHGVQPAETGRHRRDGHRVVRLEQRDFLTHRYRQGPGEISLWVAEDISPNMAFLSTLLRWMLPVWMACLALTLLAISLLTRRVIQPLRDLNALTGSITTASLASSRLEVGKAPLEVQEFADNYNGLLERLAQAWDHQRQFVGAVSHELRNPLTIIGGYLGRLQRRSGNLDSEQQRALATAEAETGRMARLLNDLLDLSRSEWGQLQLELQAVAVDEVLRTTCNLARSQLARPLELRLPAEGEGRAIEAHAEADRLQQVLLNLIENADKYSPAALPVVVELARELPSQLRISVIDQGIGIAPEDLPRIFERFHRGVNAMEQWRGSGLGLTMVKLLVESMAGTIEVESELDQGSRFTIHLPMVIQ
jgi:signal transduction histidine kinase